MDTRLRRLLAGVVATAVVASMTVGAWPSQAADLLSTADATLGTLIAGEESYVGGTNVWTDYAYDDRGPNDNGLAGGDATYPNPGPGNTADLIQLQLGTAENGSLTVAAVLETLVDGHDAVIGVGLDTDRNASTGAPSVPGGKWANQQPLGLDYMLVLPTDGSAGALLSGDSDGWEPFGDVAVTVDRTANLVSATIGSLTPGDDTWNAVGLVGVQSGESSWADGGQPIYDLAYVRAEDPTKEVVVALREQVPQLGFVPFQDKDQADVLVGRIPSHRAVQDVAFGTDLSEEPLTRIGFNAFLYHADFPVAEGVQPSPLQYNGPFMPYAVWVPDKRDKPTPDAENTKTPLLVFLHGANQYQNVNLIHFNNPQSMVVPSPYSVPAVVIFPNGRTTGWSTALAHRDALDSIEDVLARPVLNLDTERVVLTGVSSGGAGTFHMASLFPDRFTGAYSLVGGGTANLENLTNVPFRASNGLLDPLVNAQTWKNSADALKAAGTVDYRIVLVHNRSHDGPLAEGNCYYLDLLSRPRVQDPARVRYSKTAFDQGRFDLDVLPSGAYWVSDMAARDNSVVSKVDAESLAKPARVQDGDDILEVKENAVSTADFCGDHPTMRNGTNWHTQGRAFKTVPRNEPQNALQITVANLAAGTLDLSRAGIDLKDDVLATITGDGPTALTLAGGWLGQVRVYVDGVLVDTLHADDGTIVLDRDLSGTHEYRLVRAGA